MRNRVLGIALAGIGSFWLARLLTEPVGRLSASLAAMAASHDVSARLPALRLLMARDR